MPAIRQGAGAPPRCFPYLQNALGRGPFLGVKSPSRHLHRLALSGALKVVMAARRATTTNAMAIIRRTTSLIGILQRHGWTPVRRALDGGMATSSTARLCPRSSDRKAHLDPQDPGGPFRYAQSKHLRLDSPERGYRTFQCAAPITVEHAIGGACSLLNRSRSLLP